MLVRYEHEVESLVKKLDDRLFPEHLLYCEGEPRPKLRGFLHMLCAILLPFGFLHLYQEANGNWAGQVSAFLYIGGNFFCAFISALYHIGRWNANTEILLQKLDHCGITICGAGINMPVSFVLLPFQVGFTLGSLTGIFCTWVCWNIANRRPGVWRLIIAASVIVPFFPHLYAYMTTFEFTCVLLNSFVQVLGVYVFTNKHPDPLPTIFGYHEVFHAFTVIGFTSVYFCNWSVIRRTCGSSDLPVLSIEYLMHLFMDSSNTTVPDSTFVQGLFGS